MNKQKNLNLPLAFKPKDDLFLWKVSAYPALSYLPIPAFFKDKKYGWPNSEILFFDGSIYWWSNLEEVLEQGSLCIRHFINKGDDFSAAYYKKYTQVSQELENQFRLLDVVDWKNIDRKTLRCLWLNFFKVYSDNFWSVVIYPEIIAYGASSLLENEIRTRKILMSPKDISCLTTFTRRSYAAEEEISLLRVALEKDVVIKKRELRKHIQRFSWILNGYHGATPTGLNFFKKRLNEIYLEDNLKKRFKILENYFLLAERNFVKAVSKYKLPKDIIRLARITQNASFLQDDRKRLHLTATDYIIKLYRALATKLNIPLQDALYILNHEFDSAFRNYKLLEKIKERRYSWRIRCVPGRISFSLSGAREVQRILQEYRNENTDAEIRGTVAYAGKVRGRIKIINNIKEVASFPKGKILVTIMTSPDYISAMKSAIAIVTDEGGLTCHAAIVAREMKKPCIVGVKIATKVLQDNDLVEVDANKGIIKKLY